MVNCRMKMRTKDVAMEKLFYRCLYFYFSKFIEILSPEKSFLSRAFDEGVIKKIPKVDRHGVVRTNVEKKFLSLESNALYFCMHSSANCFGLAHVIIFSLDPSCISDQLAPILCFRDIKAPAAGGDEKLLQNLEISVGVATNFFSPTHAFRSAFHVIFLGAPPCGSVFYFLLRRFIIFFALVRSCRFDETTRTDVRFFFYSRDSGSLVKKYSWRQKDSKKKRNVKKWRVFQTDFSFLLMHNVLPGLATFLCFLPRCISTLQSFRRASYILVTSLFGSRRSNCLKKCEKGKLEIAISGVQPISMKMKKLKEKKNVHACR